MGNQESAARDTEQYRNGYPGKVDDPNLTDNLEFYQGKICAKPGRFHVDDFHKPFSQGGYRGNYDFLEADHSFVQWMFPIRERGMNYQAQILQKHEADAIAADPTLQARFVESYCTMLDFYGMVLTDRTTGAVQRAPSFMPQYANLHNSSHNYLRITRILKALGEVGLEHYKRPFVLHIFTEIFKNGHLSNCLDSCKNYWGQTLKGDHDRAYVEEAVLTMQEEMDPNLRFEEYRTTRGFGTYCGWTQYSSIWDDPTETARMADEEGEEPQIGPKALDVLPAPSVARAVQARGILMEKEEEGEEEGDCGMAEARCDSEGEEAMVHPVGEKEEEKEREGSVSKVVE